MHVFVIGGINMDVRGISGMQLKLREPNPGRIIMTPGGVARNIAENLVRMGVQVDLVAPFGNDAFAAELKQNCEKNNIGLKYSIFSENRSGLYISVGDANGNMFSAVSDMDIMEDLSIDHIQSIIDHINAADACIIEANLGIDVIEYIGAHVTTPIFADPVSVTKSEKLKGILKNIYAIKPNGPEAASMTGIDLSSEAGVLVAAEMLVEMGVKRAFVSLGPEGMVYADGMGVGTVPASRVHVESRSGAGDSATAALCYAYLTGLDAEASAVLACKAAELTVQTEERVGIDLERLTAQTEEVEESPFDLPLM